jgi:ribose 5-phosphate isomerase B
MTTRLVIACDHGGLTLKNEIVEQLARAPVEIDDLGVHTAESVDYPDLAHALCQRILDGAADRGILICGTGIGMSITANRHPGIRAALATDPFMSRMAREHNDANVLCLGGRVIGPSLAFEIVDAFLDKSFEGGRHSRRIEKIEPA